MAKINFNLRDASSKTSTPVNIVIRWSGKKLVYSSGESITPIYWDGLKQKANETKKFREAPEFNLKLLNIETKIQKCFRSFEIDNDRQPNIEELRYALNLAFDRVVKQPKATLTNFIQTFRDEAKFKTNPSTGVKLAAKTLTNYKQFQTVFNEYNEANKKQIDFEDIDLEFYADFTKFLTDKKNFSVNNSGKHIKTLKTILNEATDRGINKNLTFKHRKFVVQKQNVDSIYLNDTELKSLEKLDLKNDLKLERIRDLFLVGCYTGLRFSDFSNITFHDIHIDTIKIQTQKTGEVVAIPIHKVVKEIITKYKGKFPTPFPPPISNQKMNEYIKIICSKIKELQTIVSTKETKGGTTNSLEFSKFELVTTHTARRSFATNNFNAGIPVQIIMKITGHQSEKIFLNYLKITSFENAELMRSYWNKLN